jgi:nicotinamidase-related amidase
MTSAVTQTIAPARCVLLIVDIQERLASAMPRAVMEQVDRYTNVLVELARRMAIPVVVTQQYPKGLGPTIPSVEEALAGLDVHRFDKLEFSVAAAPAFAQVRQALAPRRTQWIVVGMETHVCVYQTVRDLVGLGQQAFVPRDVVASRTQDNWRTGLALIERVGGVVTSVETVVFEALGQAGTEDFKALSKLLK